MNSTASDVNDSDRTWGVLDQLLGELGELARSEGESAGFFDQLLQTVVTGLAAERVRLWTAIRGGGFAESGSSGDSADGVHPNDSDERRAELSMVERAVQLGRPLAVLPQTDIQDATNPIRNRTEWTCLIAPIRTSRQVFGCLCAWISDGVDPESRSSSLQLLGAIAELSLPFFEFRRLDELSSAAEFARRFQTFAAAIHTNSSSAAAPRAVARHLRSVVAADRCWVMLRRGRGIKVVSADGVASIQRRSELIRRLERLVRATARSRQSLDWTLGEVITLTGPQARLLEQYVDESNVCRLRVQPIIAPASGTPPAPNGQKPARILGAFVCEWFRPAPSPILPDWWLAIAEQSSIAIQNAEDWGKAPLARLLRPVRRGSFAPRLIRGLIVAGLLASAFAALFWIQTDLTIEAHGEIQPAVRRHAFATVDGTVRRILVKSGTHVVEGQLLAELENTEIEIEIRRIDGELLSARARRSAVEGSRLDAQLLGGDSIARRNELTSELEELKQRVENLERERDLLKLRAQDLQVLSPIAGEVLTWDLERELLHRPVARGDILCTVAQTRGPWRIEVRVPDSRFGDLQQGPKAVEIDYTLASAPGRLLKTRLESLSSSVESRVAGEEPSVLAFAPAESVDSSDRESGLGVRARFHCGRHPIGYVWFRDAWRTIRRDVLFRWGM